MKDGVVQQSAAALEIYRRPANRFVAGFLGSPPMNFLDGRLVETEGGLWFEEAGGAAPGQAAGDSGAGARLPVPEWALGALRPQAGGPVVLGVRPEALAPASHARFEQRADNRIDLKIWLVQPLGDRADVYGTTPGGQRLVAQLDASAGATAGETLPTYIDLARVHFFASDAGGRSLASKPA
jgi:multiple sugar transport system ATP-binding protein